jgi:hypothetical protein
VRSCAGVFALEIETRRCAGDARECTSALGLMYLSRTRSPLAVLKTENETHDVGRSGLAVFVSGGGGFQQSSHFLLLSCGYEGAASSLGVWSCFSYSTAKESSPLRGSEQDAAGGDLSVRARPHPGRVLMVASADAAVG